MSTITSRRHPSAVRARGLRRRAEREASGLCLVEGVRVVVEAVDQGAAVEELLFAPELLRSDVALEAIGRLRAEGVPVVEVSAEVFESISSRKGPQGIAAVIRQGWTNLDAADPAEGLGWVALVAVQDPGNLGSVLRTCDAVGAAGVILLGDTADPFDPSAIRASTGAVFSRRLVRATLDHFADWRRAMHARLVGASDRASADYRSPVYGPPLVLLMGGEQKGLDGSAVALCDAVVSIPMLGACDSLNLAVATGVILYEALDQRGGANRRSSTPSRGARPSEGGARRTR